MVKILVVDEFSVRETNSTSRTYPSGWRGDLDDVEAMRQEEAGKVKILGEKPKRAVTKKPTVAQINDALQEIFPELTEEEWGKDKVPNVDLLRGKLAERFDTNVSLKAKGRDDALQAFMEACPDKFKDA